ncbi:3-phosphoshikimate 1-carboxyvinyltransferase [Ornithinimicrobium cryptoxanthini]|uniref:3-phosphoshikimate 1-carboxyvinyltransferase n=1 Tax=Ornithinimicrobium cryptoxanthini TaxID=2934161 RepID=A0ABY4YMZ6_9MICO|nr:3-phosphoshikimate 1-carboxyvinyltransferase [Ornithinimicrobium cryptoxanthini]USQ77974.1 3-phosphoshikimate 1-carboxyvinyltransferase [Ornithinimicrobium cryptoxanthini]
MIPVVWSAPAARGPVTGTVVVPGSKSLTNRHLLLASLADGPTTLHGALVSRDADLMLGAIQALGVAVERTPDDATWVLTPPTALRAGGRIDCGLAGTVLRFVPPVAALAGGPVEFDGDAAARTRPIAPLLTALAELGVEVDHGGRHTLPFTVLGTGSVRGGEVGVDASASSQFVSALLLAAPRFEQGLTLRHTGERLPSLPHIEMTVQTLRGAGVQVDTPSRGVWHVSPGLVSGREVTVEPDLSSAAPFLAAAAATGGTVTIGGWPTSTTQAGDRMREILSTMGAQVELAPPVLNTGPNDGATGRGHGGTGTHNGSPGSETTKTAVLTVTGPPPGQLRGADLDLHDVGELTPVVAALAALAATPSRLSGIAHLRGHETDRLAALESELCRLGGDVTQTEDGLDISPTRLFPAQLQTYEDHRMVMAAAVLALAVPGTEVLGAGTVAKTFPSFERVWTSLVLGAGATAPAGDALR